MRASYIEHALSHKLHPVLRVLKCHTGFQAALAWEAESIEGEYRPTLESALDSLDEAICEDWANETDA